jgi:hypothetical protein
VTIPVAGVWMERETAVNYTWALRQLRDVVWPADYLKETRGELPNVFITDNDAALRKSLKEVFPESGYLLCYIHVARNFEEKFLLYINPKLSGI